MILGPLEAHFQRAFNTPNSIDFLSLKPEKIAREVHVQKKERLCKKNVPFKKIQVYIIKAVARLWSSAAHPRIDFRDP